MMIAFALGVLAGLCLAALAMLGTLIFIGILGEHPLTEDDPPPPFLRSSDRPRS